MNVLVTGGTGYVGSHLVPRLVAAGHSVRVVARGKRDTDLPPEVTVVHGDVVTGEGLDSAVLGVTAVIHLVAVIRERGRYTFERVNRQGTANVVGAMRRGGVGRLLHLSALGASPDPHYRYTYSKWQGEQEVISGDVNFTIFRPSVLVGPDSPFLASLRGSAAPFPLFAPVPGSGKALFQPLWIEDLVTCLLLALQRPETIGRTYELGGPEYLSYDRMLDLVLGTRGLRRIKVHIPLALMRPVVALMARLLPNPPVTPAELAQLEVNNAAALDSVQKAFGFPPARMADKLRP